MTIKLDRHAGLTTFTTKKRVVRERMFQTKAVVDPPDDAGRLESKIDRVFVVWARPQTAVLV